MRRSSLAAILVALVALPALAGAASVTATDVTRHVTGRLASPTPVPTPMGDLALFSDRAVWRVEIDPLAVVVVDASANDTSPFFLRYHPWDEPSFQSPIPGSRQTPTLDGSEARAWRVEVDPAAGANVHVKVRFRGHAGSDGGAAWPFTLTDVATERPCVRELCLP